MGIVHNKLHNICHMDLNANMDDLNSNLSNGTEREQKNVGTRRAKLGARNSLNMYVSPKSSDRSVLITGEGSVPKISTYTWNTPVKAPKGASRNIAFGRVENARDRDCPRDLEGEMAGGTTSCGAAHVLQGRGSRSRRHNLPVSSWPLRSR